MNSQLYAHLEAFDDDSDDDDDDYSNRDRERNPDDYAVRNDDSEKSVGTRAGKGDGDNDGGGDDDGGGGDDDNGTDDTIGIRIGTQRETNTKPSGIGGLLPILAEVPLPVSSWSVPIAVTVAVVVAVAGAVVSALLLSEETVGDVSSPSIAAAALCLVALHAYMHVYMHVQRAHSPTGPVTRDPPPNSNQQRPNRAGEGDDGDDNDDDDDDDDDSEWMETVGECRREASRLLGLIGARPMESSGWGRRERRHQKQKQKQYRTDDGTEEGNKNDSTMDASLPLGGDGLVQGNQHNSSNNNNNNNADSVLLFLEGHVRLLLTIDRALCWIRTSAGLHWGLGPHSQCIERVERAALSRTRRRTRTTTAAAAKSGQHKPQPQPRPQLQPQRKADTASVLALSSVRSNLARVLVLQAQSIVGVIAAAEDDAEASKNDPGAGDSESIVHYGTLVPPEVVDLAWIRASRNHLADLLTHGAERFCTRDGLVASGTHSAETDPIPVRSFKTLAIESTWTARNLNDYLVSHLLLDETGTETTPSSSASMPASASTSIRPITRSSQRNRDRDLLVPVLQYRQQLDALDAALWSFQLHTQNVRCPPPDPAAAGDTDPIVPELSRDSDQRDRTTPDDASSTHGASRLAWWKQIQELSAACQALEEQIGAQFVTAGEHDTEANPNDGNDDDDDSSDPHRSLRDPEKEPRSFEASPSLDPTTNPQKAAAATTKTLVFWGEGAKQKRSAKPKPRASAAEGHSSATGTARVPVPMPAARDVFAEQRLVRELQNRIQAVAALREEEPMGDPSRGSGSGPSEDTEDVPSPTARAAAAAMDEQGSDSDSNAKAAPGSEDPGPLSLPLPLPLPLTAVGHKPISNTRTREAPTSMFLGASGSLLDELKQNIGFAANDASDRSEHTPTGSFVGTESGCAFVSEEE